jgi:small redox-active disulfide protein 2
MEIKILGMGCPKCKHLEKIAREAAAEMGVTATFTKVQDLDAIMAFGVAVTPALVIDGIVKCSGRLPTKQEVTRWLGEE